MKSSIVTALLLAITLSVSWAQQDLTASINNLPSDRESEVPTSNKKQHVVKITGVRFSYPLLQHWIDKFNVEYPDVQVIIESRGSADPSQYDILVEAYPPVEETSKNREYLYIARYAVLPIANSKSSFARVYSDKGLNKELITQLYFHDIYADKEEQKKIKVPFTVYTRLQKAGAPVVFSQFFGYEQKDIKGKAIAGGDEHLLKALLRDSTGITYAPLPLIYDLKTSRQLDGITVLPVDLNGNGRVSDDEKFYDALSSVTQRLEEVSPKDIQNIPVEYIHLSVDQKSVSPEALTFLQWVINNGEADLHLFGYLKPEPRKLEREKFHQFAAKRIK